MWQEVPSAGKDHSFIHSFYLLCSCLLLLTAPLKGDALTLVFENDLFAGTDQHYTSGMRLGWLDDPLHEDEKNSCSKLVYGAVDAVPFLYLDTTMTTMMSTNCNLASSARLPGPLACKTVPSPDA